MEEVAEGYKETKIGVIPEDWQAVKLSESVNLFGGFAFSSEDSKSEGVKWLKIANVGIDKITWENESYLPFEYLEKYSNYALSKNDIVMALTRPILNSKLKISKITDLDIPCLLNQRVGKLDPKQNTFGDYIYHSCKMPMFIHSMNVAMAGTDPPNIGFRDLSKIQIPLPPLPEQQKIAEILSTWDNSIENLENLISKKIEIKKGLMQNLLTGNVRFPGFEDEWKEVKIGSLLNEVKRKIEWDDSKLYDLVSLKRRSGGIFYRESLYGHQILTKTLQPIKEDDFLISKMQVLHGALGAVSKEFEDMYVSSSYAIFNSKTPEKFNIKFFDWLSKTPIMYHYAYISSYGVHIEKMTFNLKLYLKEKVMVPNSIEEQESIVRVLSTQDKEIELLKQKLELVKTQKKGLMQNLLTGKVRVNV